MNNFSWKVNFIVLILFSCLRFKRSTSWCWLFGVFSCWQEIKIFWDNSWILFPRKLNMKNFLTVYIFKSIFEAFVKILGNLGIPTLAIFSLALPSPHHPLLWPFVYIDDTCEFFFLFRVLFTRHSLCFEWKKKLYAFDYPTDFITQKTYY